MMRRKHFLLLGLLVLVASEVFNFAVQAAEEVTIIGTVVAAATDESGKATAVKIIGDDDVEYDVAQTPAAKGLLELVDRDVEITGKVVDSKGHKVLTVSTFEEIAE